MAPNPKKGLVFVPQDEWRVKQPMWRAPTRGIAKYLFFSVTDSSYCMLKNSCCKLMRSQQTKQQATARIPDIRFNFLIGGDSHVYEGRGWGIRPSLPRKFIEYQGESLYIVFAGRYIDQKPATKLYNTRHNLLLYAVKNNYLKEKFLQFNISI